MPSTAPRTVLLLQGPPSTFWMHLAAGFEAAGHRVLHINLCAGDLLTWRRRGAINYRGRFRDWRSWLEALCRREGVTDILYYADRLPYHVEARRVARDLGIEAVAMEFGYLRPSWITLEKEGMGVYSHFPADPDRIRAAAAGLAPAPPGTAYRYTFATEAWHEVTYNLALVFGRPLYPFYRHDKYDHPVVEYLSWLVKLALARPAAARAERIAAEWTASGRPFNLVALQLQGDYQIRDNSQYDTLAEMLTGVIGSFAAHAPADRRLLVKVHPLDNGMRSWRRIVGRIAATAGVGERVEVIDGADLHALIKASEGVVVVNSTVGLHALRLNAPTKAMGVAVFDMPGLTHQGPLDGFWTAPEPVDQDLAAALVKFMAASIQVQGSFYNPEGRVVAIAEIVRRVAGGLVNEPGGYVAVPPRLEHARRIGVAVDPDAG